MDEELYIRVENGKPVDHPIAGWNLRMFYPDLNPENLPKGFERFTRIEAPELGEYEVMVGTEYAKSNYGWQDKYIIREMTPAERETYDKDQELRKTLDEIKLFPENKLKAVAQLVKKGELDSDPHAILEYLKKDIRKVIT